MSTAIAKISESHYTTELSTSVHEFIADEPKDKGGAAKGPSPIELLAASLASCTVITLRMYIDRKEWDVKSINAEVKIDISNKVTSIERSLSFNGELDKKQRERLLVIANKCPVHKILEQPIEIETKLI